MFNITNLLEHTVSNLDEASIKHLISLMVDGRRNGFIHHVADSHMNAYIRFKLGGSLRNSPLGKTYDELPG